MFFLSNLSYKNKLLFTLWIFLFVPLLIIYIIFSYVTITNNEEKLDAEIDAIYTSTNNDFDNMINELDDKMNFIVNFEKIQKILTLTEKERLIDAIDTSKETSTLFESIFYDYNSSDICIYTSNPNVYDMRYIRKIPQELSEKFILLPSDGTFKSELMEDKGMYYFCYLKKFAYYGDDYHIFSFTIPVPAIFSPVNTNTQYSFLYYNKEQNTMIPLSSNIDNTSFILEKIRKNELPFTYESMEITEGYFNNTSYIIYCSKPYIKNIALIVFSFILILIVLVFVSYFVVNYVANHLTSRLTKITTNILESDGLIPDKKNNHYDDFDIIQNKLSLYSKKILDNNDKILELELELLNSKISPHFLYNNLSTIKYVCDDEKIDKVIDILVLYYRRVFHQSSAFISIENEITNINTYIQLLKFAYDSDFEFKTDIQKESLNKSIPGNIIQPLIENAFIHGINNVEKDDLFINLSVNIESNMMCISVSNNGNTLDINHINDALNDVNYKESALSIIKKRLDLYYSPSENMTFSVDNNVTTVQIKLPVTF